MNRRTFTNVIQLILVAFIGYIIGHYLGAESTKQVERVSQVCPSEENGGKLVTSSHYKNGVVCVYLESWKRKGQIRRVEL
jgi:hypothetical protein